MAGGRKQRVQTIWYMRDRSCSASGALLPLNPRRQSPQLPTGIEQQGTFDVELLRAKLERLQTPVPKSISNVCFDLRRGTDPSLLKIHHGHPLWPVNPIDSRRHLVLAATTFMEDIWRPHILDKFLAPEHSPFEWVAQAVEPYWHFIFTMRMVVAPGWDHDRTWRVHDFAFGTRDVQRAIMDQVAIRYTRRFQESVDIDKATYWLDQIIQRSRRELKSQGYNLEVFERFSAIVLPNAADPVFVEYLIYLRLAGHQDLLKSWYNHGGMFDGIKSVQKIDFFQANRWGNNLQDLELYKLAVVADCAFNVSARTNGEIHKYRQQFAGCAFFLCARFKLLPNPKRGFIIAQLETYEPSIAPRNGELAAVLGREGNDGERDAV